MANSIAFAEKYQAFMDNELEHSSYTQWMQPNASMVDYQGGKTVKIAQLSVGGLGNYDANNAAGAYPKGKVSLVWKSYDIEMDRAVQFGLGRTVPSDSGFIATSENVVREFARKQLVPEQDIFRFNRVYRTLLAKTSITNHIKTLAAAMTSANVVTTVMELYSKVKEDSNSEQDFICFMAAKNEALFRELPTNTHNKIEFGKTVTINGSGYRCMILNELPVVFVPSSRLQTVLKVNDGRTVGQEAGGIVADTTSKQIELLILSSDAVMAIGKADSLKIFSCDEMQASDETTIDYHYLYDCWTLDNMLKTVAAAVQQ